MSLIRTFIHDASLSPNHLRWHLSRLGHSRRVDGVLALRLDDLHFLSLLLVLAQGPELVPEGLILTLVL